MGQVPEDRPTLAALGDERCRAIVATLTSRDDGLTAADLSEELGIPQSTVYRKLDRLVATPLVDRRTAVVEGGAPAERYHLGVRRVTVELEDGVAVTCEGTEP